MEGLTCSSGLARASVRTGPLDQSGAYLVLIPIPIQAGFLLSKVERMQCQVRVQRNARNSSTFWSPKFGKQLRRACSWLTLHTLTPCLRPDPEHTTFVRPFAFFVEFDVAQPCSVHLHPRSDSDCGDSRDWLRCNQLHGRNTQVIIDSYCAEHHHGLVGLVNAEPDLPSRHHQFDHQFDHQFGSTQDGNRTAAPAQSGAR